MKKVLGLALGLLMVLVVAGSASATQLITNGDFETGDLTGWTYSGDVEVVNPSSTLPNWVAGVQGMDNNFALLGWDIWGTGTDTLNQTFTIDSGYTSITISFNWAFDYVDKGWGTDTFLALVNYETNNAAATITMADLETSQTGWSGTATWGYFTQTFDIAALGAIDADMIFTLTEVSGWGSGTNSTVALDNVSANAVPEPGTLLLLAAGIGGLAFYRRKKAA